MPAFNCNFTLGTSGGHTLSPFNILAKSVTISPPSHSWSNSNINAATCEVIKPNTCEQFKWNECDLPADSNNFCSQGRYYMITTPNMSYTCNSYNNIGGVKPSEFTNSHVDMCTKGFGPETHASLSAGSAKNVTVFPTTIQIGCR